MKFSILIAVYNDENYIESCIKSVLNQKYDNYEIIIINDGSTDNTLKILNKYVIEDKRIILINQNNQGICNVRNSLISKATGDYILFLDSDDYLNQNCLLSLYNILKKQKVDLITFDYSSIYNSLKINRSTNSKKQSFLLGEDAAIKFIYKDPAFDMVLWRRCYSKKLIKKIKFVDGLLPEDYYSAFTIYINSNKVVHLEEILYNYRCKKQSLTLRKDLKSCISEFKVYKYVYNKEIEYFKNHPKNNILKAINSIYLNKMIDILSLLDKTSNCNERNQIIVEIKIEIKLIKNLNIKSKCLLLTYHINHKLAFYIMNLRRKSRYKNRFKYN